MHIYGAEYAVAQCPFITSRYSYQNGSTDPADLRNRAYPQLILDCVTRKYG